MTCLSIIDRSRARFPARDPTILGCRLSMREGRGLRFRKHHEGFELVSAGFALPQMSHALRTEILRPFRHKDRLAALRAEVAQPQFDGFPDARSQFHCAFFLRRSSCSFLPYPRWERIRNACRVKQCR